MVSRLIVMAGRCPLGRLDILTKSANFPIRLSQIARGVS